MIVILMEVVVRRSLWKGRRWIEVGRHCVVFIGVRGLLGRLELLTIALLALVALWLNF